jgi:hypothetical protein
VLLTPKVVELSIGGTGIEDRDMERRGPTEQSVSEERWQFQLVENDFGLLDLDIFVNLGGCTEYNQLV